MKKSEEKEGKTSWAIFLAALIVRALWTWSTSLGEGEVRADAIDYFLSAARLMDSGQIVGQWGMRALHMPLYPLFMAAVFCWSGPSVAAVQAVQVVIGSAACVALYRAARLCAGPRAALFAGWSAVFYFGLVHPCGRILTECLYASLLSAFLLLQLRRADPAPLGAVSAALYLTRPEGLLAGLSAAALERGRRSLLILALLAAAAGAWSLRNLGAIGVPTPGTANAGFTAWFALPRTIEEKLGRGGPPRPDPFQDELERDRYYRARAAAVLRESPPATVLKAALFNLASIHYPFLPAYEATYVFLTPFWLAGLAGLRRRPALRPAAFLAVSWTLLFVFVGGADSRFRQLFAPCLVLLSAGGFEDLSARLGRRFPAAAFGWAGANALVFLAAPALRQALLEWAGR